MKRMLSSVLLLCMLATFSGCGMRDNSAETQDKDQSASDQATQDNAAQNQDTDDLPNAPAGQTGTQKDDGTAGDGSVTEDMKDMADDTGDLVGDAAEGAGDAMKDAGNAVKDAADGNAAK